NVWVRELDKIRVKGKNQAVSIYHLIQDIDTPLNDHTHQFLALYAKGRQAYMNRDFAKAIIYFEEAYELEPHDKPVLIHIERAKHYQDNPPPEYWDGVHTMTRK
ncbi:MAG: tetratricopeptide repeat protein, partial [Coleofasciculus sp. C2-GNP5-27]